MSTKLAHLNFHGIPWDCLCQRNWRIWSSMEFHRIPWNCSCQRNWHTPWRIPSKFITIQVPWNSMEFHGPARVIEIGALQVPWNSMEFHGTAGVIEIGTLQIPWNSMELLVSSKLAHSKFHGIPWKCCCQRNWRTPSSMEFHGTSRVIEIGTLQVPWNSMEFHGTSRVIEIVKHSEKDGQTDWAIHRAAWSWLKTLRWNNTNCKI